jgi:hypothetical protein
MELFYIVFSEVFSFGFYSILIVSAFEVTILYKRHINREFSSEFQELCTLGGTQAIRCRLGRNQATY